MKEGAEKEKKVEGGGSLGELWDELGRGGEPRGTNLARNVLLVLLLVLVLCSRINLSLWITAN